ncbi:uncharacterized protein LOC144883092 [Branchiostoma floridae x Branchiostoma japonicum]
MKRHVQQNECNKKPRLTPPIQESQLQGTPTEGSSSPSLRSIQRLKKVNKDLKRENDDLKREKEDLNSTCEDLRRKNEDLKRECADLSRENEELKKHAFSFNVVAGSRTKNLLQYYTGFTYVTFMSLFSFLVPNEGINPVAYTSRKTACMTLSLKDQLFLATPEGRA